jgi:O-acetyl-ADP-ribose deacetylase (regulator of RNase III)
MPLIIEFDDITTMRVDAIVNAANTALQAGGGVCGAIFKAAGSAQLQAACDAQGPPIQTGEAVITDGFALPAKYIVHTAGPVYHGGDQGEEALLRACYTNSLALAAQHGCKSIAFPLISSGIYGYPRDKALDAALSAIRTWLETNVSAMEAHLVLFDQATFTFEGRDIGDSA